jgi:hypothetical protein
MKESASSRPRAEVFWFSTRFLAKMPSFRMNRHSSGPKCHRDLLQSLWGRQVVSSRVRCARTVRDYMVDPQGAALRWRIAADVEAPVRLFEDHDLVVHCVGVARRRIALLQKRARCVQFAEEVLNDECIVNFSPQLLRYLLRDVHDIDPED